MPEKAVPVPPTKEQTVKELQQAMQEPVTPGDISPGDEILVAMLAGSTAQSLKQARAGVSTEAGVLDPASVVRQFRGGTSVPSRAPLPAAPGVRIANVSVPNNAVPPKSSEPQLELDLFRKMDMTDVYNKLDSIQSSINSILDTQKKILNVMEEIMKS